MANGGGKELRVSLDPNVHAAILATAKARGTTPARLLTEAFDTHTNLAPRLLLAISALEAAKAEGDRVGAISDFIADLYRADATSESEPLPHAGFDAEFPGFDLETR